jgi:hypothetical protein
MGILNFCSALPLGSLVNRKMGPPTSYLQWFSSSRDFKEEEERDNSR